MTEEEYKKTRLEDQINWYDTKSQFNQRWFKTLRRSEIVAASLIPLLAGFGDAVPYYRIVIGALGALIAIITGFVNLGKYQENWIEYRTTAETLKHEKYLYETRTKPYNKENSFNQLVYRVEKLISQENSQWNEYVQLDSDN